MENNEQTQSSDSGDVQQETAGMQETKEQFVARKAYEEVTNDMHKYKQRVREAQARATELETKLKSFEEQQLKEQERWKELYEREKNSREEAEKIRSRERDLYLRSVKISALKAELGGRIRDEYLQLANIDGIEISEDGSLSSESVLAVANSFRKEHPALIPSSTSGEITGQAPVSGAVAQSSQKSLQEMTMDEKISLLSQMKNSR